jgi:hypothetical protein
VSCPTNRTYLLALKTNIETALDNAWTSYLALTSDPNESFSFDDGSGRQSVKKRRLNELEKSIENLTNMLERVNDQLDCKGGVVSLGFGRLG